MLVTILCKTDILSCLWSKISHFPLFCIFSTTLLAFGFDSKFHLYFTWLGIQRQQTFWWPHMFCTSPINIIFCEPLNLLRVASETPTIIWWDSTTVSLKLEQKIKASAIMHFLIQNSTCLTQGKNIMLHLQLLKIQKICLTDVKPIKENYN